MKLENQDAKEKSIFTRFKEVAYNWLNPIKENIIRFTTDQGQSTNNK